MLIPPAHRRLAAFTLIELLVVMAIIAILITLVVGGVSTITARANEARTRSQFNAISQGLELVRGEQSLGGEYPPSRTDHAPSNFMNTANPRLTNAAANTPVAGAHLLVFGLLGADLLGPPGFRDANNNGIWSDDTHSGAQGMYQLNVTTGQAVKPRFGSGGYVGDEMRQSISSIEQMRSRGLLADSGGTSADTDTMPFFLDSYDMPILYYKANRAAQRMVTTNNLSDLQGVYRQGDNRVITGAESGPLGIDFGPGDFTPGMRHAIKNVGPQLPNIPALGGVENLLSDPQYTNTFTKFVLDPSVSAQFTPVRKQDYILVSAGNDQVFGTADDITNFDRNNN